ncbi:MAG: hypothetical protein HOJ31_10255 [Anaerolineae bacterium]|jgi:hypothetical protein|nr:hypothetical protein [Anaerolineae bacterium]
MGIEFTQKLEEAIGVQPEVKDLFELLEARLSEAMAGDMVLDISPETVAPEPTSAAWTRNVVLTVKNAAGDVHDWLNAAITTRLSIADTSTAGTASIVSTTLTLVKGTATIVVSGDAQDWLNTETDTLTVADLTIMGYTVTGGTSVETFTA